jgi:hypothetical protein
MFLTAMSSWLIKFSTWKILIPQPEVERPDDEISRRREDNIKVDPQAISEILN